MTLASSTLQIRRHEDSGDLNIVIFVGIGTLPFYAINMDDICSINQIVERYCADSFGLKARMFVSKSIFPCFAVGIRKK
ncbi:hypothetical protein MTR_3g074430 [Medicago truncatula]|uniref:Uncharacterized protein n=1 Tax=Medicago truncatula TaxID=3880 RepID=A0A072UZG7_MEDTR|nr:hypothetical protein MTR_3g074430 [Medicago truncatula]